MTPRERGPSVTALVLLLTLLLVLPAAAQQHGGGGGGSGGDGGKGGEFSELLVIHRDVNGVPIFDGPWETEHGTEYCVQPITTEPVPDPYHLLEEEGADEFLPTTVNPVDGREVTLVPLFAHYPEFLPDEGEDDHAHTTDIGTAAHGEPGPPDDHDEEGGEPCDPLVLGGVHNYNDYVREVELERLNLARSPEQVLAKHLEELELLLATTDPSLVTLETAGRITFDGTAIDAMPKLQGMRESLLERGTIPGAEAYPFPFRLTHEDFDDWSTWELSAFALGGAASKFGSINVDVVAYHDRIMNIPVDWDTNGDVAGWPVKIRGAAETDELFVDYSDLAYSREDTFPGCVTYLDPATWKAGYKVEPLLEAVAFSAKTPKQDNLAGYAQLAEDARAVILFIHGFEPVIAAADAPGLETCAAQRRLADQLNGDGVVTPTEPTKPTKPTEPVDTTSPTEPGRNQQGSPWKDLAPDNVHYDDVLALALDGILEGYEDGTFRPANPVTRGQVASVLARTMELEGRKPATPTFSDIVGSVHEANIEALVEAGVIEGFPDGTFRPSAPVRRDQTASLVGRWLGLEEVADGPFADVGADSVHGGFINALHEAGVIKGKTATTFDPRSDIRRDQFAAMVNRAR